MAQAAACVKRNTAIASVANVRLPLAGLGIRLDRKLRQRENRILTPAIDKPNLSCFQRDRTLGLYGLENQLGCHCNGVAEAQIDGAFGGKELVYSKSCLAVRFFRFQSKRDVNAPNHQNTIFQFDFTNGFRFQSVVRCGDLTRLQRASKCAGESTGCRRDDVIQSRGMVFECSLR